MRITHEFIERGLSAAGGLNAEQLQILGAGSPPKRGWRDRAVGRTISEEDARRFLALKGQSKKQRKAARRRIAVDGGEVNALPLLKTLLRFSHMEHDLLSESEIAVLKSAQESAKRLLEAEGYR